MDRRARPRVLRVLRPSFDRRAPGRSPAARGVRDGHLIGYVDLHGAEPDRRELGFLVGERRLWGRGVWNGCGRRGLHHGFAEVGLREIWGGSAGRRRGIRAHPARLGTRETGTGDRGTYLGEHPHYRQFGMTADEFMTTSLSSPDRRVGILAPRCRWWVVRRCADDRCGALGSHGRGRNPHRRGRPSRRGELADGPLHVVVATWRRSCGRSGAHDAPRSGQRLSGSRGSSPAGARWQARPAGRPQPGSDGGDRTSGE